MPASVAVLNTLSIIASSLPNVNPPIPVYAIIASDTFFPLTVPTSWGEFSPRYETQVSDYPVEYGAFAIYNKVRRPITIDVTLIKAGSDVARFSWLTAIQQIEASLPTQLYTLISPQGIYADYTIVGMFYETRPDRGSNLLYLTLRFMQVQQIPSSAGTYSDTLAPKSGPVQDLGRLYTQSSTALQDSAINAYTFISS